ncbi:MAG: 7-cyano-7-deazaguanine synthase [Chloroflexi bacterium]|nr:7-cyano-7-deazaguanine synthase [Chloroflexota bacterium]
MKVVVLTSGGIDSALLLHLFKKEGHSILPLHINYNQLAETREWEACKSICEYFSLTPFRMDVTGLGKLPSGLTNSNLDVYEKAFLPTRNLTFVTLGAAYAYSMDTDTIGIGLLKNHVFPDQTKEFVEKAQISISESLGKQMKILVPLIELDKRDVLMLAHDYKIPNVTYYCHSGTESPCGRCISCKERQAAESALAAN